MSDYENVYDKPLLSNDEVPQPIQLPGSDISHDNGEFDYFVTFTESVLGLELYSDEDGFNCIVGRCVSSIARQKVTPGSQIVQVNGRWLVNCRFEEIRDLIKDAAKQPPLVVTFRIKKNLYNGSPNQQQHGKSMSNSHNKKNASSLLSQRPIHYEISSQRKELNSANAQAIQFVFPRKSDYIECAMNDHAISNCYVMKRIIHFLQFYEKQQSVDEPVSIYDHMQSLNGYDISHFLEDWYQVKINHLNKEKNDLDFLQDIVKNNDCDGSNNCKYVRRYQRDREKDKIEPKSKDFDVRNFILMDQMDSIHSFLFHSMQRRDTFVPFGDVNDEKNKSLNEYSVDQVVHILNKDIFENLKKKNKEKIQKHKEKIIDYIKENKLNGNRLCKMKRKEFILLFQTHLNDKKVTAALGTIFKELMVYKQRNANGNDVIISSKSKFITEEKIENSDDDEKKKEYYSFGEKYLYNPKLYKSSLYAKAKYKSIKEEFFEYCARTNKDEDASELLQKQMKIIDAMEKRLQPLLREFVKAQSITSSDVLWNKDIETSRKQLKEIIANLCEYSKDFDDDDWDENNSNIAMESEDIAFKVFAINKIQKAIKMNKEIYIHQPRVNVYVEKCKLKMNMDSVKRMKAVKNKNNNDYGIKEDDPIGFEHVFALILYSQCTKLCTTFRYVLLIHSALSIALFISFSFTYRRLKNESLADYKKRHSLYANMGRLLFECFLFFASANSKVSVLYHGTAIELLFKALECKFIAPTSTTSEQSVACSFAKEGVVMKLESAESNKFIKTIDMSLFSCFDNEYEHFIFDYKLRIIDLFVPRIRSWIGKNYMNRLLLLDLLSNNIFVDNEQLLKEKNQKGLITILECIAKGTMGTFTKYEYVNAFIESLITQSDGIKFNMKNAQLLIEGLRTLFIDRENENSPFEIEYQNEAISICKLRQENEESKENHEEVEEKKLLNEWGLGKYWDAMKNEGWDDLTYWKDITDDELKAMDFKRGHMRKFKQKIADKRGNDKLQQHYQRRGSIPKASNDNVNNTQFHYKIVPKKKKRIPKNEKSKNSPSSITWILDEAIGKGVFKGWDKINKRMIAIKEIKYLFRDKKKTMNEFGRETLIMKALRHNNIVQLYQYKLDEKERKIMLLMEYVPGSSIKSIYLKQGVFAEMMIQKYVYQIVNGLNYAHGQGIIHRNIKGKNILIDNNGIVKISDFGSAILSNLDFDHQNNATGNFESTPLWTAPEALIGAKFCPKVDVWSMGCVIIEMATAKPPWHECKFETASQALAYIAKTDKSPKWPQSLSLQCQSFINLCLYRDPKKRKSMNELLQHIFLKRKNNVVDARIW